MEENKANVFAPTLHKEDIKTRDSSDILKGRSEIERSPSFGTGQEYRKETRLINEGKGNDVIRDSRSSYLEKYVMK